MVVVGRSVVVVGKVMGGCNWSRGGWSESIMLLCSALAAWGGGGGGGGQASRDSNTFPLNTI